MQNIDCYKQVTKFSLFNDYFIFVDTDEHLADNLFTNHKVRVHFDYEYTKLNSPYHVVLCHVRKWDTVWFRAAMCELPGKMIICGKFDYLKNCADIWKLMDVDPEQEGMA